MTYNGDIVLYNISFVFSMEFGVEFLKILEEKSKIAGIL